MIPIPTNLYFKRGRVNPAALSKLLDQGISLIFNQLDEHVPALRALCKNLKRKTSERVSAAAIMTSGRGGALKCHYDAEDLVILQIASTKRWQVFNSPIVNPVPDTPKRLPPEDSCQFSMRCCSQAIYSFCRPDIGITARTVHIGRCTSLSFSCRQTDGAW